MPIRHLFVCLIFVSFSALAQEPKELIQTAVQSELAENREDRSLWLYLENKEEPHVAIKQWVAETSRGSVKRVIERNGRSVSPEDQSRTIDRFLLDPQAQEKQRRDDRRDDQQAENMIKLLPSAFVWTEVARSEETSTFHYRPNPKFDPPTREARVFASMEGDMVIHNDQKRIVSLSGHLIHDVTFGWGLLGRLTSGGSFSVQRRELAPHKWQITETHVHIRGHALLFKSISEEEDDVRSNFEPLPADISFEQAKAIVMKK